MKKTLTLVSIIVFTSYMWSQSKPFPQNINYPNGYRTSLISSTAVQNAYTTWKNLFLRSCNGMYRVGTEDVNRTISESIGYGMLLTAYHGEKEYFDGLFEFYKSKRTDHAYGLMAWEVTCDGITDPGSATDGDIDVAFSLIVAHNQWGENYLEEAKDILSILKEYYFVECGRGYYIMKPGGWFGGCNLTDISYYSPGYFNVFAEVTGDSFWETVANHTYVLLNNTANDSTGLVPDWQTSDGVPTTSGRTNYYKYDASRTPWRMSLDYLWNGSSAAKEWCTKITNFAASIGPSRIVDGYDLDGTPHGQYNNSAFVGGFAVGAMCNSQEITDDFARRLLQLNNGGGDNQYFNLSLRNLYMLVLTGNFWKPGLWVSVEKNGALPNKLFLEQNYPNPFNPSTIIQYSLNKPSQTKLDIYNLLGQKVKTLVNSFQVAGEYSLTWNGTDEINYPVGSGIYFYQLKSNENKLTKKMLLIR